MLGVTWKQLVWDTETTWMWARITASYSHSSGWSPRPALWLCCCPGSCPALWWWSWTSHHLTGWKRGVYCEKRLEMWNNQKQINWNGSGSEIWNIGKGEMRKEISKISSKLCFPACIWSADDSRSRLWAPITLKYWKFSLLCVTVIQENDLGDRCQSIMVSIHHIYPSVKRDVKIGFQSHL